MNNETQNTRKTNEKPDAPLVKTGYKTVDAVLYIFVFLYDANRRNLRAFINTLLILSLICVCSLYIDENRNKQKAVIEAVNAAELRNEKNIAYLKSRNDTLYRNLLECNHSINDIYQSVLKRADQESERQNLQNKKGR
jgi:hypothetical protein